MNYFLNNRDRKTILISNLFNSILLSVIGLIYLQPENIIGFFIVTFIASFIFQYFSLLLPIIISGNFMNATHPNDKIRELKQKIKEIEYEIKELDYKN